MKIKLLQGILITFLVFLACSLPNECQLSEKFTPSWTQFVLDKGFNLYEFRVSFNQIVEIYTGDCADEKYNQIIFFNS